MRHGKDPNGYLEEAFEDEDDDEEEEGDEDEADEW